MSQEVTLTLNVDETNLILESLGSLPFVRVHDLIYKIKTQAQAQFQPSAVKAEPTPQQP